MTTQGKRLKKARIELGLNQEEMVKDLDMSRQYLSNLENDRDTLNNEKFVKLHQIYGINPTYIILGIGAMFLKQKPLKRCVSDDNAAFWMDGLGDRTLDVQKFFDYSDEKMADILHLTVEEYLDLIMHSKLPPKKAVQTINAFKDNFSGFTIDELLYDENNTFKNCLVKKADDKVEINLKELSPAQREQLNEILKGG